MDGKIKADWWSYDAKTVAKHINGGYRHSTFYFDHIIRLNKQQVRELRNKVFVVLNKAGFDKEIDDDMFNSLEGMIKSADKDDKKLAKHIILNSKFTHQQLRYIARNWFYVLHKAFVDLKIEY
jgi:hypothetical protein